MTQIGDSLQEAHEAGMIHRAIKPAHIYVAKLGRHVDVAKVLDFGLVKVTGSESPDLDVSASTDNKVLGTPAYLPPELTVAQGQVDGRADLYALGCVAYYLLTGKLVFETKSPIKMVVAHATRPPPKPSTRTAEPIPEALESIVMHCLEKNVEDRPESANYLASLLRKTGPADSWTVEARVAWWRQHLPQLLVRTGGLSDAPRRPKALLERADPTQRLGS
jgi:serine/threonine-protein kinase